MSTRSRRPPPPPPSASASASSSSAAKRPQIARPANKKPMATTTETQVAKKRTALADVTNQKNGVRSGPPNFVSSSRPLVPCATKVAKTTKEMSGNAVPASLSTKSSILPSFRDSETDPNVEIVATGPSSSTSGTKFPAPSSILDGLRSTNGSPSRSVSGSVSLDESMSTCDSLNSPEFEYVDSGDISEVKSIEKKTTADNLCISDYRGKEGNIWKKDIFAKMKTTDKVVDVDNNLMDPQFCATFASDIYKHLRESEANRRPSMDFMENIQNDINAGMRAILIDWLVEVAEEFRFVPDTLFLTVNYVDRYLSGNVMNRKQLQLLGVSCLMIAAKYEEIIAPQVDQFCYITDNTYGKEEVLQMESTILEHLKYEMTAPTAMCFLRRFSFVAQQTSEVPSLYFQCLASYIAELSLLEYSMLCYAPSLIAASAAFLAKYILSPTKKPWNSTLRHYTHYQASDLCDCVKALHRLCFNGCSSDLPAVREKYCQHKYKFVAKKYCPPSIPPEFFQDLSN